MKKINLAFSDFWDGFNPKGDNIFDKVLGKYYDITYTNENPDVLFFSVGGNEHKKYNNCIKILFTPENFYSHKYIPLDHVLGDQNLFKYADYSITSFDIDDPRNFRLPCYIRRYGFDIKNVIEDRTVSKKTKKVLYLQRNCVQFRDNFVRKLQNYIQVDCLGSCIRNNNTAVGDKIEFMKEYKFVMGFENSSHSGYNTEKLVDGFISKTIPLYWGDTNVHTDYNKKSFINLHDFNTEEELIEVDQNDDLYESILSEQPIINYSLFDEEKFINFIKHIFND